MTVADQTILRGDPGCSYKGIVAKVQPSIDPDAGVDVVCFMSTDSVDADTEVVLPGGADFSRFDKNPVLMLCHGYGQPGCYYPLPVGKVLWTKRRPHGVMAGIQFADVTDMARDVKALFATGMLRSFSIGFISLEASLMTREEAASRPDWQAAYDRTGGKVLVHRKWMLIELSVAPVPSNPDALVTAYKAKGLSVPTWLQFPEVRTMPDLTTRSATEGGAKDVHVVPFAPCKDVSQRPWEGDEAIARIRKRCSSDGSGHPDTIDFGQYEKFFTFIRGDRENVSSYHSPHHDVEGGKMVLLRHKLGLCVAELDGGRAGGLDVPESDLSGIEHHLREHYVQDLDLPYPGTKPSTANSGKTLKCYGVGTKSLSVGDHVAHEKSGLCGRLKSIHTEGLHPRHSRDRDEGTIQATEDEPVGLIAEHDDDHDETGATRAHYMHHLSMVDDDGDMDGDGGEPTEKSAGRADAPPFGVGGHVRHKASGACGEIKSIHKSGTHTLGLEGDDTGREVDATEGEPVVKVALHNIEHKCHGPMSRWLSRSLEPHPEPKGKALSEGSGAAGGYTVTGDAAGSPDSGETVTFDDETDDDDPHEEEGTAGYSRGDHVLVRAPHFHGKGEIKSFHHPKAPSLVRRAHNDLVASADEPAALVHIHKEMSDGHVPTDLHVAAHLKHLKKLDAPLRLPSKVKVAVAVPAAPGRKAGKSVERTVELAIPTVLSSDQEAAQQQAALIRGIEDVMKRTFAFLE